MPRGVYDRKSREAVPPPSANGSGPYRIVQVFIDEIPRLPQGGRRKGKYQRLYLDLMESLLAAPESCAVAVFFDDTKQATRVQSCLRKYAERQYGLGAVIFKKRLAGPQFGVYAHRGPNWK